MDKGKKPISYEEEDDDFLKIVMEECDKQDHKLTKSKASNGYGSSFSKQDLSVRDETDQAVEEDDDDEDFCNFLSLSIPHVDPSSETENCISHVDNMESRSNTPTNIAEQTSVVAASISGATPMRPLRKVMPPDVLARLSMQDPKKARRIITNRMSAVRAKEKKKLHTYMLEQHIQALQIEAANSKTRLALIQRDTLGWKSENAKLKNDSDMILQRMQMQDSLNGETRNEINELRMKFAEINGNGQMLNSVNQYNTSDQCQHYYEYHHQVPNYRYGQVEQIQDGIEEMNIGQQYHNPWQYQQVQSAGQYLVNPQQGEVRPQFNQESPVEGPNLDEKNPYSYLRQQDESK